MNIFSKIFNKKSNKVHFYVVKDNDGDLTLWMGKPKRFYPSKYWYGHNATTFIAKNSNIRFYNINPKDYDNLKWEDEPVEVFLNLEN